MFDTTYTSYFELRVIRTDVGIYRTRCCDSFKTMDCMYVRADALPNGFVSVRAEVLN